MTNSEIAAQAGPKPEYARLHLGTAPDSWGIWFPDDPKQPYWSRFSTKWSKPVSGPSNSARSDTCPPTPNSSKTNSASGD